MREKVNSAGDPARQHKSDLSRTEKVERSLRVKRKEKAAIKHLGMHQPNTTLQGQDAGKKKEKKKEKDKMQDAR
jgi:hypothetical protein